MYSQDRARDDIRAVLDGCGLAAAHIVGLSMGGFAALHFGFTYPDRALSLVVIPNAGHTINLETAEEFNRLMSDFLHAVDSGRWPTRDPRAISGAILGTT